MGVTKEAEEYEKEVIDYLKKDLFDSKSNIELVDVSVYKYPEKEALNESINTIKELNNKIILFSEILIS